MIGQAFAAANASTIRTIQLREATRSTNGWL